jgi:putative peptidoglycan lipid II flippase
MVGLAREYVKADLFGATGLVSAFEVANIVPTMIYDLLVGGIISSALVPVMSDHAAPGRDRGEFWRLGSTLFSLAAVSLAIIVVVGELLAPQIAWLFGARNFQDPSLQQITTDLLRVMLPAVLFLNMSGLIAGTLFSLQRFTLPAFTAAVYNTTIVIVALLRPDQIGSLAWGVLAGSAAQLLLQLPGLELRQIRWVWNPGHPALRRIGKLYVPIALGVIVSQVAIGISYNLATQTGDESVALMRYATNLVQLPLGLVATAISVAILPTLAQQALLPSADPQFKTTLAHGLTVLMVLILPAATGMFVLARPIVGLAFEHGDFTSAATQTTSTVLRLYLLGLPFAAVDQLLIFAFYARKNTLTPALVGVASVVIYLAVAQLLIRPLGLYSLMIADSVKHVMHAAMMTLLLHRAIGGLSSRVGITALKALGASVTMGLVVWAVAEVTPASENLAGWLAAVGLGGTAGLVTYGLLVKQLDILELNAIRDRVLARLLPGRFGRRQ